MDINYWAVFLSAIASMIVGSIWYGPLFGKTFIKAQGLDKKSKAEQEAMMKGMVLSYVWQFLASLVMFYVLAFLMSVLGGTGIAAGMELALLVWLGFIVTLKFGDALWGGKSVLFWLSIGNLLITFLIAGALIGALQ